jgi:type IV pilus assembly protein PilA
MRCFHGRLNNCHGFSLIELLIVVAIILIIAAIATPNLLKAKIAANQSAAVGNLGTISTAEANFYCLYNDGYATSLVQLGGPAGSNNCANANLIDNLLGGADPSQKSGYQFALTPSGTPQYTTGVPASCSNSGDTGFGITATPIAVGVTGQNSYCIDITGVMRFNTSGVVITAPAGVCDATQPPLQ